MLCLAAKMFLLLYCCFLFVSSAVNQQLPDFLETAQQDYLQNDAVQPNPSEEKPELLLSTTEFPVVQTSKGAVKGRLATTPSGKKGLLFLGIPFAEPPVYELRFRSPIPKSPWSGIWDATKEKPACMQDPTEAKRDNLAAVSEDCLYLTLHVPADALDNPTKNYSVIYYIYGGAWEFGAPTLMSPVSLIDNFVSRGIIFITVSYRLGVFGFWSSGTKEAPGNYMLEDAILGLQWTQDEIAKFGGNPGRVTLQGHSSGSMACSALALSPRTAGLFQQVTLMSGSMLVGPGQDLSHFNKTSIAMGCDDGTKWNNGNIQSIMKCMRQASAEEIMTAYTQSSSSRSSPRIDGPGGILPEAFDILAEKRRPLVMMLGTTTNETPTFPRSQPQPTREVLGAMCVVAAAGTCPTAPVACAEACLYYYDVEVRNSTKVTFLNQPLKQILNDFFWYGPVFKDADSVRSAGGTVYLYSFSYIKKGLEEIAPSHAMDLEFGFGYTNMNLGPMSASDLKLTDFYPTLFVNFAKYGNPTPTKPKEHGIFEKLRSPTGFNYYDVNSVSVSREFYHFGAMQFWNRIIPYLSKFAEPESQISKLTLQQQLNLADNQNIQVSTSTDQSSTALVAIICTVFVLAILLMVGGAVYRHRKQKRLYKPISKSEPDYTESSKYSTF